MPQAVDTYLNSNNFKKVDEVKRDILNLYEDDFRKIDPTGKLSMLFDAIPAQLSGNASRYNVSSIFEGFKKQMLAIQNLTKQMIEFTNKTNKSIDDIKKDVRLNAKEIEGIAKKWKHK